MWKKTQTNCIFSHLYLCYSSTNFDWVAAGDMAIGDRHGLQAPRARATL